MLVEALFSAAIVVMAFAATTLAFNATTSSATRDINKSGALTVAQGQIEYMRSVGQGDINKLVGTATVDGLNGTSRTVKYAGVSYTVNYTANYVDSMGSSNTDSCGSFAVSGASSAQFVYIGVSVSYPIPEGTAKPVELDSYFAPEGGSSQSSTGTLKVYVLDVNGDPFTSGVTTVNLMLGNATVDTKTLNANGCVLFTGLARGVYTISVPDGSLQDLYMTSGGSNYTRQVSLPARGSIVQKVQLAAPVTITPTFKTMTGPTTSEVVTPSAASPFVRDIYGNNGNYGSWIATNTNITDTGYTDYTTNPGKVFMPHFGSNPVGAANQLYPDPAGYLAYPGVCTVNNPGSANLTTIAGPSWPTSPELWVTRLGATAGLTTASQPTPNQTITYYWGQSFVSAQVKARLTGDNTGDSPATSDCGPRPGFYKGWVSLGFILTNNATIATAVQGLPTGQYDLCVIVNYKYSKGTGSRSWWGSWSMANVSNGNTDAQYGYFPSIIVPYKGQPMNRTVLLDTPTPGSTTACG